MKNLFCFYSMEICHCFITQRKGIWVWLLEALFNFWMSCHYNSICGYWHISKLFLLQKCVVTLTFSAFIFYTFTLMPSPFILWNLYFYDYAVVLWFHNLNSHVNQSQNWQSLYDCHWCIGLFVKNQSYLSVSLKDISASSLIYLLIFYSLTMYLHSSKNSCVWVLFILKSELIKYQW